MEMLGEALQVAPVEELDLDVRVSLAQLAQLAVLAGDERLLHGGDLDVKGLLGKVEVGRERLLDASFGVLLQHERPRLVGPRAVVVVEDLGALELPGTREPRRVGAAIRPKDPELGLHRQPGERRGRTRERSAGGEPPLRHPSRDRQPRAVARLTLIPQKREFFELYNRAAKNI